MRVLYHTFGCKANQYDTERMRQELEARGARTVKGDSHADVCVVNTCTVTNAADAEARRFIRRLRRERPEARVIVAGCSAALRAAEYVAMSEVEAVVAGHDPVELAGAVVDIHGGLVQLGMQRSLDRLDLEPVGASILTRREGATRGWLKVQDGCDRRCSFCATRLARGTSRSRPPEVVIREASLLAGHHPELVLTGIHIGHYGRDLDEPVTLSELLAGLLDQVPDVRFRLGSIEATEVDELLLELMATSGGRVAPHLHMPLQSGADPVLRRMRRWHTRETYRARTLEIAARLSRFGLGADVITGFPGETEDDHEATMRLVEELPYTYLHVFPFSPKDGTEAAGLPNPVPQRIAGERSRAIRTLAQEKGRRYRGSRSGESAEVTLEAQGRLALTGDYLRVGAGGVGGSGVQRSDLGRLHRGRLRSLGEDLYIELDHIEIDPSASSDMDLSLHPQLT